MLSYIAFLYFQNCRKWTHEYLFNSCIFFCWTFEIRTSHFVDYLSNLYIIAIFFRINSKFQCNLNKSSCTFSELTGACFPILAFISLVSSKSILFPTNTLWDLGETYCNSGYHYFLQIQSRIKLWDFNFHSILAFLAINLLSSAHFQMIPAQPPKTQLRIYLSCCNLMA